MNYKGLKRMTLEQAATDGQNIEVEFGSVFEADSDHLEIVRALKLGAIEEVPRPEAVTPLVAPIATPMGDVTSPKRSSKDGDK